MKVIQGSVCKSDEETEMSIKGFLYNLIKNKW